MKDAIAILGMISLLILILVVIAIGFSAYNPEPVAGSDSGLDCQEELNLYLGDNNTEGIPANATEGIHRDCLGWIG